MLLKSIFLALVGSTIAVVITLFRQYKHRQLQQLAAEKKEQENQRMQLEWQAAERKRQPLLQIVKDAADARRPEQLVIDSAPDINVLPWHEEQTSGKDGYDGELTQMSFNHVVKSFKQPKKEVPSQQGQSLNLGGNQMKTLSPLTSLKY